MFFLSYLSLVWKPPGLYVGLEAKDILLTKTACLKLSDQGIASGFTFLDERPF